MYFACIVVLIKRDVRFYFTSTISQDPKVLLSTIDFHHM